MRVTPLDILKKQFSPARKGGLDTQEVQTFLDEVRASLEELLAENQRARELLAARDAEIAEFRSQDADVKETLRLARRVADDMERGARREADVIVGEARIESERILQATADERREMEAGLVRLRGARAQLLADIRAVIEAQARLLDELDERAPAAR